MCTSLGRHDGFGQGIPHPPAAYSGRVPHCTAVHDSGECGAHDSGECGVHDSGECGVHDSGECGAHDSGECGVHDSGECGAQLCMVAVSVVHSSA